MSEEFAAVSSDIAEKVNSGALSLESAIQQVSNFRATDDGSEVWDNGDAAEAKQTFFSSAFLEHLFRLSGPDVIRQALDSYRNLLNTKHWDRDEKRGTFALRYAKAVLSYWRYLTNLPRLIETADVIEGALPSIDAELSPRLTRDLWFARARLLENVGIWKPGVYHAAAEAYRRGLSVPKIKHELEARGRALTDYANTLSRIKTTDEGADDRKIIVIYEEALSTFDMEDGIIGKALALSSYAIYLNERLEGERGASQERALALIQEAIDLCEATPQELLDKRNDLVVRTLASAYLAKSNIIRHREIGDAHQALLSALDALRTAWIGSPGGTMTNCADYYLDLGHLNVELYSMTGELSRARDAMYAYQQAEALLQAFPREFSQALLGTAMLVSEVPTCVRRPTLKRVSQRHTKRLDSWRRRMISRLSPDPRSAWVNSMLCAAPQEILKWQSSTSKSLERSFSNLGIRKRDHHGATAFRSPDSAIREGWESRQGSRGKEIPLRRHCVD